MMKINQFEAAMDRECSLKNGAAYLGQKESAV